MSAGMIFIALTIAGAVAVSGMLWLSYETSPYYDRLEHFDEELEELIFDEVKEIDELEDLNLDEEEETEELYERIDYFEN